MTIQDTHLQIKNLVNSATGISYPDVSTLPDLSGLNAGLETVDSLIPDLGVNLRKPSLRFTGFSSVNQSPQLALSGLLQAGGSEVWTTLTLDALALGAVELSLGAVPPGETHPADFTLEDLFQLVGGVNIFQELPSELNIADRFLLKELLVAYDFAAKKLNRIKVSIGLGDWNIFYGMTIQDAQVVFDISEPFLPTRIVKTTIGGGFEIRNQSGQLVATLGVELFVPGDGSDWEMLATGGLGGEGNGFLDAVTGDIQVSDWLPDSISDPTLLVNEFFLRFSPRQKKIFQTRIEVGLDMTWTIVDNLLSLEDPYFAFDIVWPDNPDAGAIRVLDLFVKNEKARLTASLNDIHESLEAMKVQTQQAAQLIATSPTGELANLEAAYRTVFLQKADGIQQRFTTEVKNKLEEIKKLETVQSVAEDPQKAALQTLLNELGLGQGPSPVKALEKALEDCKTSLRGSLFQNASNHAGAAKAEADKMIVAIAKAKLEDLLKNLQEKSKNKPENKTRIKAQLGGNVGIAGSTVHVLASRDETKTWRFRGMLEGDIAVIETARQFLGQSITPPSDLFKSDLTINTLEAEIVVPPSPAQKSFRFLCGVSELWQLNLGDFSVSADSLLFAIERTGGQTKGALSGAATFNGMKTVLTYAFAPGQTQLSLNWEGIIGTYNAAGTSAELGLKITNKSIGDVISLLVKTVKPQLGTYRLPEPWDFLDKIPLDLDLKYTIKGPQKGRIEVTKPLNIDLVVVQISGVSIVRTVQNEVTIAIQGLNHPKWDAADPASPPPDAGGLGKRLIDLRLLAMGQRVSLQNAGQMRTMKEAIAQLRRFTLPGDGGLPDVVRFNPNSNWLIGMDFGLLQVPPFDAPKPTYALQLSALFNDPDIYGLRIELAGDKIPPLKGLQFEILYTKINDSIGKYHVELVLPDIMRYIEMGAVSLVLPVVVVDVYTNGDFFIDFGFPYDFDFKRSFSITVIVLGVPVLGSGGFYFGKLSGPTAPPRVPTTTKGTFNPVMVFGLGLQIGIGKYIQKGPLTARFSLTVVGMIEGIVATFNPDVPAIGSGKDVQKSNYLYLRGALGIIGILEGAVDFKVIKAKVLIRLEVIATVTYESYRAMPISIAASVTVHASIRINLGLFKVTIEFSFKAQISATFTVGQDQLSQAPWYDGPQTRSLFAARGLTAGAPMLILNPLPAPAEKDTLYMYATLQPTVAWTATDTAATQLAFCLVMACPSSAGTATGATPFEKMADSVFQWVTQGVFANGPATRDNLEQLLRELRGDSLDILPYASLWEHLRSQFKWEIKYPEASEFTGTAFPVFPFLKLKIEQGDVPAREIDFGTFSTCTPEFLYFLYEYAEATLTQPDDAAHADHPGFGANAGALSLTEQLFEDYFLTIAREMTGATLSILEDEDISEISFPDALAKMRARNTAGHLSSMLARFYMGGQRLPKHEGLTLQTAPATFDQQLGIFQATGQQFAFAPNGKPASVSLTSTLADQLSLPTGAYALPANLQTQLTAFGAAAATPPAFLSKVLRVPFQMEARSYPLSRAIDWESQDGYIWEFSESLLRQLGKNAAGLPGLKIRTLPEKTIVFEWGVLIEFGVKKTANPTAYEIIGADEEGIALLEKIILDPAPDWKEFHLCYSPVENGLRQKKLSSLNAADLAAFLAQINLSTETNPIQGRGLTAMMQTDAPCGVLDKKDFIDRLWAASIVRSGGHYLYYQQLADGAGLPAELFGQDDTAALYLLVSFEPAAPKPYLNCAITDRQIDLDNDLVFARDEALADKIGQLPPGALLLEATRNQPAGDSLATFEDIFHLLAWQIPGGLNSAPIGPETDEQQRWHYEQVVPARRFANDPAALVYRFPANDAKHKDLLLPDASVNPYAGVGQIASVRLQTRDVYGNAIPGADAASALMGYSDALLPVHQWSGTQVELEGAFGDGVRVKLLFSETGLDNAEAVERAWRFYSGVYFQLYQQDPDGKAHVRADLRSTLLGEDLNAEPSGAADPGVLFQLRSYVGQVCHFLERKRRNQITPLPSAILHRAFEPGDLNNASIFELLTEIQLRRGAHLHPDFAGEEAVRLARTPVKAFSGAATAENYEAALRFFAEALESKFPEFKLATGFDKEELDNHDQKKDLFLVRLARFAWTKGEPVVLALPPLSTQLLERTTNVRAYSKETGFNADAVDEQTFTRIDMDDWAQLFLSAFDAVLSPELAGAIYLLDKDALGDILGSKKVLADAIAGKVKPVLQGESADRPKAAEKLKQRLLMELAQAYEVNAVVQYPVAFATPAEGGEVRLYGAPLIGNVQNAPYSLSNAKISAAAESSLDFLFSTQTVREEPVVGLDLKFKYSHLEYGISDQSQFNGYQSSSWLAFVLPPEAVDLGHVDIPVVLRDFPEAPALLHQAARQSEGLQAGTSAEEALRIATGWDYLIRYNQRFSAQDWLKVEVQFNLPEAQQMSARGFSEDLLDALAVFSWHWPALRADLLELLPGIDARTIGALSPEERQQASNAINAFARLARNAANRWESWAPPATNWVGFESSPSAKLFQVREIASNGNHLAEFEDLNPQANPDIAAPVLLVGPDEVRGLMAFGVARSEPLRALALERLNVLAYQNALAAVYLTRNEALLSGKPSALDFVYFTPQTRFPQAIVPLLDNDIEIDMGELAPGHPSLAESLNAFFAKLLGNVHLPGHEDTVTIQVECTYAYKLAPDPAQPFVRLPVVLAPPYDFQIGDTSLAEHLAREIQEWLDAEQPAAGNAEARLVFNVAVFSTTSTSRQPILRLRNVVLKTI
jgi:hypothetical protein